jgi:hypothetical protein
MSNDLISEEQFKALLPKQFKGTVTQEVMDEINNALSDPIANEAFKENLLSYTGVMRDGKFKIGDYLKAVKYVSFKLLGEGNLQAYLKTFPDRHQEFINKNTTPKDMSSYAAMYNKNKLVNLIFAQTLIPHHVLHQELYTKSLYGLFEIANDPKAPARDRAFSYDKVMSHLKPPENTKIELDIGIKSDSMVEQLRITMAEFSAQQLKAITLGTQSVTDIAHQKLVIDGEFTSV